MNDETPSDPVVEDTVQVTETAPEVTPAVEPVAPVEEPVKEVVKSAPVESVKKQSYPVDRDVLRAFLNAQTVRNLDEELLAKAFDAIGAGKIVKVSTKTPFLEITNDKYEPGVRHTGNYLNDAVVKRS